MILLYIDPGAGSLVIQAILAAALAIPFYFRTQVRRIIQRLRSFKRNNDPEDRVPSR